MVHSILLKCYRYRIEQALTGEPHAGPLPRELNYEIWHLEENLKYKISRNTVLRLRECSKIIEPAEKFSAFEAFNIDGHDALGHRLIGLVAETDSALLEAQVRQ